MACSSSYSGSIQYCIDVRPQVDSIYGNEKLLAARVFCFVAIVAHAGQISSIDEPLVSWFGQLVWQLSSTKLATANTTAAAGSFATTN